MSSVIFSISKDDKITNVRLGVVLTFGFLEQYLNFKTESSFYIYAYSVSSLAIYTSSVFSFLFYLTYRFFFKDWNYFFRYIHMNFS